MYKRLIEKQGAGSGKSCIWQTAAPGFPLKPGWYRSSPGFPLRQMNTTFIMIPSYMKSCSPIWRQRADLIGTYFYFDHAPRSMNSFLASIRSPTIKILNLEYFHTSLKKAGYELLEEEDCGCTTDSGANLGFGFHVKGEKMHLSSYHGRKVAPEIL